MRVRKESRAVTGRRPLPVQREGRWDGSPRRFEVCCWCCCCCYYRTTTGAAATPVSLQSLSGSPGLDPRGPRQALVKSLRSELVVPHPPSKTPYRDSKGGGARGAVATPHRVSPGGAAGPGLLQPPGCAREPSPPLPCCQCHDWSRLSPTAGSASAQASLLVKPPGGAPRGM